MIKHNILKGFNITNSKKEILYILITFVTLIVLTLFSKAYNMYNVKSMNDVITDLYEHPLQVSNASLTIQREVYKIHKNMREVILNSSHEELQSLIDKVNQNEKNVYSNLKIIEENILGQEGRDLYKQTFKYFQDSEAIRKEVLNLVKNSQLSQATAIIKSKGNLFNKLNMSADNLYVYAKHKADGFKQKSDDIYNNFFISSVIITTLLLLFAFFTITYIIRRLSKYLSHNNSLSLELLHKKNELETIMQEAPSPIILYNEDGDVLMVNKVCETLTGYKYEEINTIEKWTQKAYGENQGPIKEYIDTLYSISKQVDNGEFSILTEDGRTIVWKFKTAPLGIIDGKRTLISTAMDITELKVKDNLMIIQSRYAAVGEMLGMIAHQWRQPLSVITMTSSNILADIELDELDEKELEKQSHTIIDQAKHLSATIDDFKNFFRTDIEKEKSSLDAVFEDTLKIISASLNSNYITLTINYDDKVDILVNRRELVQVLINIIVNSKDALLTNEKGDEKRIEISVKEEDDKVKISVCDNGGGIEDSIIDKVFDPYFSTKKSLNGTGLGLYMSKTIVTQHLNGLISVSNSDEGACFTIEL